jgi:two-component system response regulator HydG
VKLLRVLQFREFSRIGSETSIKVDVRVLAATSRNLRMEMDQGNFREDLYYRLHVIPVVMPPLRERISDLPALANHFLQKLSGRSQKRVADVSPQVLDVLLSYSWPGNIRELENAMEHAFILAKEETIELEDLPAYLRTKTESDEASREGLDEMEKQHLARVLKECRGNKHQAAKRLKISRSTLYRKLEAYKLLP